VELSNRWAKYSVRWSELRQQYSAQFSAPDLQHVFSTTFEVDNPVHNHPPYSVRFCVADIYFTQDADAGDADAGDADAGANDP